MNRYHSCTFIVPTIGRDTLARALESIAAQTDTDWNALVIGDGMGKDWRPPWVHDCIFYNNVREKLGAVNHGGLLRDYGISCASGDWLCFLDDDDRLDPHYVEWLKEESPELDILVFRMKYPDGLILPSNGPLFSGGVGISFAIRAEFQKRHNLWFPASSEEDWIFLRTAMGGNARLKVSDRVAYYVRH